MEHIIPEVVKQFGTKVYNKAERYIIELKGLEQPLQFLNPTDNGEQQLKGDGNDILILNGLSQTQILTLDKQLYRMEQTGGRPVEEMKSQQVQSLLNWLAENNYTDRYCSDQKHKNFSLIHVSGHIFRKAGKECCAAVIEKGSKYGDAVKTQEALVDGALFIVDGNGDGRITNAPEGYKTVVEGMKVIKYVQALQLFNERNRQNTNG